MADNNEKDRKSDEQKIMEQRDNAGVYAGGDRDNDAANGGTDGLTMGGGTMGGDPHEVDVRGGTDGETMPEQNLNAEGEAQNINDKPSGPGELSNNDRDVEGAKNKAMQGINQGRDTGSSGNSR